MTRDRHSDRSKPTPRHPLCLPSGGGRVVRAVQVLNVISETFPSLDASFWPLPHRAAQRLPVPDLRRARARWPLTIPKGKARCKAREEDTLRYQDSAGRFADLHALRHSYITRLSISGMPLPMAQRLARHSSPTLTANTYTHIGLADSQAALDRAFGKLQKTDDSPHINRATGTEGAPIEPETERSANRTEPRSS